MMTTSQASQKKIRTAIGGAAAALVAGALLFSGATSALAATPTVPLVPIAAPATVAISDHGTITYSEHNGNRTAAASYDGTFTCGAGLTYEMHVYLDEPSVVPLPAPFLKGTCTGGKQEFRSGPIFSGITNYYPGKATAKVMLKTKYNNLEYDNLFVKKLITLSDAN